MGGEVFGWRPVWFSVDGMPPAAQKNWFVYLVRAANGALYCGISDDPVRRFAQHQNGKGARFFFSSPAQALAYVEACSDKGQALRREHAIKRLTKAAKEQLVLAFGQSPQARHWSATGKAATLDAPSTDQDCVMHELILHHYSASPFAEKARLMLGFKQLSWRSVDIPPVMPKPDLTALTGGYRKTPVLQVGADIYCDTALIARRLDQEKAVPALLGEGREFAISGFAAWADSEVFQTAVSLAMQPESLAVRFGKMPEAMLKAFMADRKALFSGGSASRVALDIAKSRWPTWMARLEQQLGGEEAGAFLFGDASVADFALAHPLWFVKASPVTAPLVDAYPAVAAWLQRVLDFGHGSASSMSAAEAIEVARTSQPAALPAQELAEANGFALGQQVAISAVDYGVDPVVGELLFVGGEELILRREDPRAGVVHVHFPRLGFQIGAVPQ
jgi:predicted GIY-YIG superfamily endonuclease/glutathione S-transferase